MVGTAQFRGLDFPAPRADEAASPPLRRWKDVLYDGSGNDAEASSDAHGALAHPLRTRRSAAELNGWAREPRTRSIERRRSSGRRAAPLPFSRARVVDEQAVDDEPADDVARPRRARGASASTGTAPPQASRLRARVEALFFFCLGGGVLYKMATEGNAAARAKVPELALLLVLSFVCFFTHMRATCTVWATRVRYLRKTDMGDALYAMLLLPLLGAVALVDAVPREKRPPLSLPTYGHDARAEWRVSYLPMPDLPPHPEQVVRARSALLDMFTLFGLVMGLHILATTWYRKQSKRRGQHLRIEDMSATTAFLYYVAFALLLTAFVGLVKTGLHFAWQGHWLFGDLKIRTTMIDTLLFQCCLYVWTRVARQNFTLGELSLACMFNTMLVVEAGYLTLYMLLPASTTNRSFRTPTPLLAYQLALIVGMMLVGLLLSPLLALSRVLAQRPTHRLRWPDKRNLHRRLLALGFFLFTAVLVLGALSPWVWWLLGKRDPWLFVARFMLQGRYWWSRLALLAYWGMLCNIALLSLQLMVNRVWQFATVGDQVQMHAIHPRALHAEPVSQRAARSASERAGTMAATRFAAPRAEGEGTSLGPALDVSVNSRRKFFHLLAVLLFLPGIAWDPAFMHLGFSAAFALFVFAEYVRYCAVYPLGASLHVFLSQFLDAKDSGLVILSHMYLLSGCAVGVWIETRSPLLQQLGLLVLGVGDSCASLVGRKYGRLHWPRSSKTVEGTLAFFGSVVLGACVLRVLRLVEAFHMPHLLLIAALLALAEGVSEQNDNLVLPVLGLLLGSLFPIS